MPLRPFTRTLLLASSVTFTVIVVTSAQQPQPAQLPAPPDVAAVPPDAIVTTSGLASKVLTPGTGTVRPTLASTVKVHYSGWTPDGLMFDSSVVRGEPSAFGVTRVIRGWTEGVQLMVKGEKRRFWIPSALAYGENPRPGAPKGNLVFDVEMIEITTPTDATAHLSAYSAHKAMAAVSPYKLIPWQSIGPSNHTVDLTSVAVATVQGQRSIYVGSASGGVWKSVNRGLTWRPIFENEATASIGALAVTPSNPAVVWVGTGQSTYSRPSRSGTGIYKSIDGGRTWQHMGLGEVGTIARIIVHPTNANIVYVAVPGREWMNHDMRGVFKTTDGGKTWVKVLYRSPSIGADGLDMDSKDPNTLYASMSERVRRKWSEPAGEPGYNAVVWQTTDAGATWRQNTEPAARRHAGGGRFNTWIDPRNPKVIYTAEVTGFTMSADGGKTSRMVTGIQGTQFEKVELDMATPFRAYGSVPAGEFGSLRVAVDPRSGRRMFRPMPWQKVPLIVGAVQAIDPAVPNVVYAYRHYGDFGRTSLKPAPAGRGGRGTGVLETNLESVTPKGENQRAEWMAPIVVSPLDPLTVYAGYQYVYRSRDRGDSWERISEDLTDNNPRQMIRRTPAGIPPFHYQTISQIAESPLTKGVIYAGTDDGNLHVTRDDGKTWTNIGKNLPMALKKWVSRIVPSKYDAGTVFVAQRGREDDDFAPYLWKSTDYGTTWTSLVGNIPSGSINVIREDPSVRDVLYAGNDFGVYVSKDGGEHWNVLGADLPSVEVSDLQIHPRDHLIVISTYGRGMWVMDARKVRAGDIGR